MPRRPSDWSVRDLKERCELLKTDLEARRLATAEELAAYWPGGASNRNKDTGKALPGTGPWIFCYANFVRFRGRAESHAAKDVGAEGVALRILAAEPEVIANEGLPEGAPDVLAVYQKSPWTMGILAAHDLLIAHLNAHIAVLQGSPDPKVLKLVAAAIERRAEEIARCLWAAVTPGPLLPWDALKPAPQAPEWIRALDGITTVRIQQAYNRVNATNLAAMKVLLAPDPEAGSSSAPRTLFAGLFAGVAAELGFTVESVIKDRPALQLLGQMQLRASTVREAKQDAEQKRGAK